MMSNLGWRFLENRRYDARLLMFYKIVYGLVAIPVPSYFERPEVYTRHTHPLAYIQIHTSVCYYQYSFMPRNTSIESPVKGTLHGIRLPWQRYMQVASLL